MANKHNKHVRCSTSLIRKMQTNFTYIRMAIIKNNKNRGLLEKKNGIDRGFVQPTCNKIKVVMETQNKQQGKLPGF